MQQADIFQAIADPGRRYMLQLLSKERMSINALAEHFDMSRPAVSKHIKLLSLAGFIAIEDIGRERHCTLNKEGFDELQSWIDEYDKFWAGKLKKLDELMDKRAKR
ncbi:MAG: metalloregulator ArsR/SmtB family transcription factor [Bacteroidetes bacterium]|nr:metalloregulator ArsR/SmtB family transcription factor [Bacteroidota bacterium]